MVATSQPQATEAGLRALADGGTAADACVAAAAMLCVVEPMSTGIGGDAFAITYDGGRLTGLNASGRSPRAADMSGLRVVPQSGPTSVTVPGAVSGWAALLERHGRLGLERCLRDAVAAAEDGFEVTPVIAGMWRRAAAAIRADDELRATFLPAPAAGERHVQPGFARTLRRIAEEGPGAFYTGAVAQAIAACSWLDADDLAAHAPEWVEPLRLQRGSALVCELPPNGQGAAALQAIGIADGLGLGRAATIDRVHLGAEAMKLAFADAYRHIADGPLPTGYLDRDYLAARRELVDRERAGSPGAGVLPHAGTVYLCAVDGERQACSFIQSVYTAWGSGVGVPGHGFALQNRGAGFAWEDGHPNRIAPGRRPFHTIIPGMLLHDDGSLNGPFGLMGGHMQPQGHLQLVTSLLERGLDPQPALAEPRWRLDRDEGGGWLLALERGLWELAPELADRGHRVVLDADPIPFGSGQAILVRAGSLVAGSDPRRDGRAGKLT
jgi:gamma-glutamyltranspeptidase / glutathione hydrolase